MSSAYRTAAICLAIVAAPWLAPAHLRAQQGACERSMNTADAPLNGRFQFDGYRYYAISLPRSAAPEQLVRLGEVRGRPVYTDSGVPRRHVALVYVPAKAGCLQVFRRESPRPVVPAHLSPPAARPAGPTICVVEDGELRYRPLPPGAVTADTAEAARAVAAAYPATAPTYAQNAYWYQADLPLSTKDRLRVKYGLPRVLAPSELVRVGWYHGTPVFGERGAEYVDVLYIPIRPGCEFLPYQDDR